MVQSLYPKLREAFAVIAVVIYALNGIAFDTLPFPLAVTGHCPEGLRAFNAVVAGFATDAYSEQMSLTWVDFTTSFDLFYFRSSLFLPLAGPFPDSRFSET